MRTLISTVVLETGSTIESTPVSVAADEIEVIIRSQTAAVVLTSLIRVTVLGDRRDDVTFRPIETALLRNTDTSTLVIPSPPSNLQVRAEVLEGKALFSSALIERPIEETPSNVPTSGLVLPVYRDGVFEPIEAPPANHYFGTDSSGKVGYFPLPSSSGSRVWNETPSGGIDGVNSTFTLITAPDPPQSLQLYKNGILMREGSPEDFVLSGATLTYNVGQIPVLGDSHVASYDF